MASYLWVFQSFLWKSLDTLLNRLITHNFWSKFYLRKWFWLILMYQATFFYKELPSQNGYLKFFLALNYSKNLDTIQIYKHQRTDTWSFSLICCAIIDKYYRIALKIWPKIKKMSKKIVYKIVHKIVHEIVFVIAWGNCPRSLPITYKNNTM